MKMVLRASINALCDELEEKAHINRVQYANAVGRKEHAWKTRDYERYFTECSAVSYHYSKMQLLDEIVNELKGMHDYEVSKDAILK